MSNYNFKEQLNQERGSALLMTIIMTFVMALMIGGYLNVTINGLIISYRSVLNNTALNLGEAGVEGGGERQAALEAETARGESERPLGGDVNGLGPEVLDQTGDPAAGKQGQPDLRIGWAGHGAEQVRRDQADLVSALLQPLSQCVEGSDDAIDLGKPGIGDDEESHASSSLRKDRPRSSAHLRISRRPSSCSTRAVQLSTQSPSLQ